MQKNEKIIKKIQEKNGQLWGDKLSECLSDMTRWMSYLRGLEDGASENANLALETLETIIEKLFQFSVIVESMGYEPKSPSSSQVISSISSFLAGEVVPRNPIPIWIFEILGERIHFLDESWNYFLTENGWEVEIQWD